MICIILLAEKLFFVPEMEMNTIMSIPFTNSNEYAYDSFHAFRRGEAGGEGLLRESDKGGEEMFNVEFLIFNGGSEQH